MSSSGGGGESFRVSIPANAKKTIHSIREITGKQHSDEEIYTVLKECAMDPNETAQKLLYLDTFHEVKRKRDRKKETSSNPGRGVRGGRGHYSSNYVSDAGGGRSASARRDNGAIERGSATAPGSNKTKNNVLPYIAKSPSASANGPPKLANGSLNHGRGPEWSANGVSHEIKDSSPDNINKLCTSIHTSVKDHDKSTPTSDQSSTSASASVSGVYLSDSDPVLASSLTWQSGAVGTIKQEVGNQWPDAESELSQGNNVPHDAISPKVEKAVSEAPCLTKHVEEVQPQGATSEAATVTDESDSQLQPESTIPNGQHVTFPVHFQVCEALKNGLTFGSFGAGFGLGKHENGIISETDLTHAIESSKGSDETTGAPSPSSHGARAVVQGDNHQPQSTPIFDKVPESDGSISSGTDLKFDLANQANQQMQLQAEANQSITTPNMPAYNFGFMPPLPASHLVQADAVEAQARDVSCLSNFVNGNMPAPSSSSTPPVQSSVQAVPIFRQPFPPNYFPPYGHYLSPYYMPPAIHQFLSPNGLPQQPSTGNFYVPPGATTPGVKFPLAQFKPGTNAGNPAHITIPSGYGSYSSPLVGFNPISAVTPSSTSKDDLAASQLKENQIYTTGPPSEGPGLWMPAPGQDMSNLQVNSLYNLPLHGQHVAFSPAQAAAHGTFPGLYQPAQTMAAPSNVNPLLQQSQAAPAAVDTVGGPSAGAYQQPPLAQMNWNTNY